MTYVDIQIYRMVPRCVAGSRTGANERMRGTMNDFQREGLGPWLLRGDQPATRGKPDWDRDVIVRVAMGQLNLSPSVTP